MGCSRKCQVTLAAKPLNFLQSKELFQYPTVNNVSSFLCGGTLYILQIEVEFWPLTFLISFEYTGGELGVGFSKFRGAWAPEGAKFGPKLGYHLLFLNLLSKEGLNKQVT